MTSDNATIKAILDAVPVLSGRAPGDPIVAAMKLQHAIQQEALEVLRQEDATQEDGASVVTLRYVPPIADALTDCYACGAQIGVLLWEDGRPFLQACPACGAVLHAGRDEHGDVIADVQEGGVEAVLYVTKPTVTATLTAAPDVMTPLHPRWREFTGRLAGAEACNVHEDAKTKQLVWTCKGGNDKSFATAILEDMGGFNVPACLRYFEKHGGYCDCEILFNVGHENAATQEDGAEAQRLHFERFIVTGYTTGAETINVGIFNAEDTQPHAAVTVSEDSETIYVYAAGDRSVQVLRYEDFYGQPAQED